MHRWGVVSGVFTTLLAVFASLSKSMSSEILWQIVVGSLGIASLLALWRELKGNRTPKPHPLRLQVENFICDLSESQNYDPALIERANELLRSFAREGILPGQQPCVIAWSGPGDAKSGGGVSPSVASWASILVLSCHI